MVSVDVYVFDLHEKMTSRFIYHGVIRAYIVHGM